mmetsp:Transcript_8656/g.10391  ORF Transcript_8656/g.10391 Transcript_8656/m.10391 type:complete len:361 (-) Transcript_8656:609-1691(-)
MFPRQVLRLKKSLRNQRHLSTLQTTDISDKKNLFTHGRTTSKKRSCGLKLTRSFSDDSKPFSRMYKRRQREDWYRHSGQFQEEKAKIAHAMSPYQYANFVQPNESDRTIQAQDGKVSKGDKVEITFSYDQAECLPDKIESMKLSSEDQSVSFTIGASEVLPGFEAQILGMKVDETKRFTVAAKDAYGVKDPSSTLMVSLDKLPAEPKVGDALLISNDALEQKWEALKAKFDGDDAASKEWKEHLDALGEVPKATGVIASINEGESKAIVDLNHPLAGLNYVFEVKVNSVEQKSPEEKTLDFSFDRKVESFLPEFEVLPPPYHLEMHYESLSFIFVDQPDIQKVKYPFEMNLDTFVGGKYR